MPIFHKLNYGEAKPLDLRDWHSPDLLTSMRESFSQAFSYNPTWNAGDWAKANPWQAGGIGIADDTAAQAGVAGMVGMAAKGYYDPAWRGEHGEVEIHPATQPPQGEAEAPQVRGLPPVYIPPPRLAEPRPQPMPLDKQAERIELAGLAGQVKPHASYDEEALAIIIDSRRDELASQAVTANAPAWHAPFSLASAFAAGMLDPLAIASAFIPVIGHARLTGMLARASGPLQRAFIRAGQGAASGAVGGALLEPVISAEQQALQRDYGMAQSLINVSMGAALGSIIAPVAGKVTEWRNARGQRYNDYEFLAPSEESNRLMAYHRDQIIRARMEANPGLGLEDVALHAQLQAAALDREMRHTAWAERIDIAQAYEKRKVSVINGERFGQEAARLESEAAAIRQELGEYAERRRMAEDGHARLADDSALVWDAQRRLERTEGSLAEARRMEAEQWREMEAGDSLYMRKQKVEPVPSSPELIKKFSEMPAVRIDRTLTGIAVDKNAGRTSGRKEMLAWIKANHPASRLIEIKSNGKQILLSNRGIRNTLFHGVGEEKIYSVPYLDAIIENACLVKDNIDVGNQKASIYMSKVAFDGNEYVTAFIAHEDINGAKFHDHELSIIKSPGNSLPGSPEAVASASSRSHENQGSLIELLRYYLGVKDGGAKSLFQLSPPDPATGARKIMGAYTPGEQSIIRVFRGHDHATVMHEIGHHAWRMRRALALGDNANPLDKQRWLALERHYGVEPGGEWSRAQHEAFAGDFVGRHMIGHNEPPAELAAMFASMREEMLQLYETADAMGVAMSPASREVFDRALTGDLAGARHEFAAAIADLNTRRPERMFVSDSDLGPREFAPELDSPERLRTLAREAAEDCERELANLEARRPELAQRFREQRAAQLAELERQRQALREQAEIMPDLVACYL